MSRYLINIEQNFLDKSNHFDNATWAKTFIFIGSDFTPPINPTLLAPMLIVDSNTNGAGILNGQADINSENTDYFSIMGLFRLHPDSSTNQFLINLIFTSVTSFYFDNSIRGLYDWTTDVYCNFSGVDSRNGDIFYGYHKRINSEWVFVSLAGKNTFGLEELFFHFHPTGVESADTGSLYMQQAAVKEGIVLDAPLLSITSGAAQTLPDDWVTLDPEYNLKQRDIKQENTFRARSGKRYIRTWGKSKNWRFGVKYVNSSTRLSVNSWWLSNAELLYAKIDRTEVNTVRIENNELPINQFEMPYKDLYKGTIELGTY